jgi:branched-chain amino acid transport system permease protein
MVYGIVKLINFAHADILMLGAYMGYFVMIKMGVSLWAALLAFLVAMAVCAVIGVVMEKTCYKPLRNSPRLNALITAIGVSLVIENGSNIIPFIGPNPRQYTQLSDNVMSIFKAMSDWVLNHTGITITPIQILVIIVSLLLMLLLNYIVNYTRIGKAMRAVSYDMNAAKLMGIPVDNVVSFTFAVGAMLAASAGILYAMSFPQINPYMGIMPGLKCFIAAVLGGIGSIPGAMLGGLLIGVVESLTKGYIDKVMALLMKLMPFLHIKNATLLSDGIVFALLILILLIRPSGILGKPSREKV